MVMQSMRNSASNKFLKFILFGLLMMATLGLVMMDVGGFFRNGNLSGRDVAQVGNDSISLQYFDGNLRRALGRLGISPSDAYRMGYVDKVLAGEINSRVLAQAAEANDVLIGRKRVAEKLQKIVMPMATGDQTPQDVLKQILINQGINEREMVDSMQREMSSSLMASTIQSGFSTVSEPLARDLYRSENEKRDVEYIVLEDKDMLKSLPPASEDELKELYQSTKESFAIPETRILQLVRVKDDQLKKTLEITEEEIKQVYESNKDSYVTSGQHMLEESLFDSEAQAKKVFAQASKGKPLDKAVKDVTGQAIAYLGPQAVEDQDLPPAIKEAVLKAKEGEVIGPLNGPLGYYVIRIQKIIKEGAIPFENARKEIREELYQTKLSDQKYALAASVDDILASGASLEDAASQVDLEITALPPVNQTGKTPDGKDVFQDKEKIRATILKNGFALGEGETSAVTEMPDGSFMAVHAKSITPQTYKPFEEVRDGIEKRWTATQAMMGNKEKAAEYMTAIMNQEKTFKAVAQESGQPVTTLKGFSKKDEPKKPLNPHTAMEIFGAEQGKPFLLSLENATGIAVVTGIAWPGEKQADGEDFKKFRDALTPDIQNEAIVTFLENKSKKFGARVNSALLERAYGSPPAEQ